MEYKEQNSSFITLFAVNIIIFHKENSHCCLSFGCELLWGGPKVSHFPERLEGYYKKVTEIIVKISNTSAAADHYLLGFYENQILQNNQITLTFFIPLFID